MSDSGTGMSMAAAFGAVNRGVRRAWRFVVSDAWDIELTSLRGLRLIGVKIVRVIHLVLRGFRDDQCPLHASALTFNTLMAIVPVLALSLSLARVFGGDELAKRQVKGLLQEWTRRFEVEHVEEAAGGGVPGGEGAIVAVVDGGGEAEDVFTTGKLVSELEGMVDTAFDKVANISFAALGGVGLVLLLWMVVTVLGRVESAFNRVWGVAVGRSLWRKFTDYISVLVILPFLAIAASSMPVVDLATGFLNETAADAVRTSAGSGLLRDIAVVCMTSLCFAFLIMFMPNTRVRLGPGLAGGVAAGLLFIGWMFLCAALQVGVAKYGKIYGSFAVVPIVLAWVFVSWEIVLFGAEVAFAVQNCGTYRLEQGARRASMRSRVLLAVAVTAEAARGMVAGEGHFDVAAFARERRVPVRFLNDVIEDLVHAGLLGQLSDERGRYALLRSPENLRVQDVVGTVMCQGVGPSDLGLDDIDPSLLQAAREALDGAGPGGSVTVRQLLT